MLTQANLQGRRRLLPIVARWRVAQALVETTAINIRLAEIWLEVLRASLAQEYPLATPFTQL